MVFLAIVDAPVISAEEADRPHLVPELLLCVFVGPRAGGALMDELVQSVDFTLREGVFPFQWMLMRKCFHGSYVLNICIRKIDGPLRQQRALSHNRCR